MSTGRCKRQKDINGVINRDAVKPFVSKMHLELQTHKIVLTVK